MVLAAASGMFTIGVLAVLNRTPPAQHPRSTVRVALETDTPAATAETFLDAWRKRDHETAALLSTGTARQQVQERKRKDESLTPDERDVKAQVWDAMAQTRLSLEVDGSTQTEEGERPSSEHVRLATSSDVHTNAASTLQLSRHRGEWRVTRMTLGEQLQEAPDFLDTTPASP